ncbi:MAG: sugar transferase, partial [Chitinophagaceae bacterium]
NGEVFNILKFRTMVKNAEANGAVFTTTNDSRITPFGKFLRKTRLDEFPQFFNILVGDMGVIGPRPERPVFVNEIAEVMPFYETRHVIKPGLTGWAQVNYSYGDSISDSLMKLQYDLYYIKHRSIFLDINIVIKTLSTVLFYRGQ